MRTLLLSSFLAAAALAACTPYSPDLGPAPFKCGPAGQEPRCPDGYTCIPQTGSSAEVCIENGGNGVVPDGGGVDPNCNNDSSLEPNESTAQAWVTPVDNSKTFPLAGMAICPSGDKDTYSIMVQTAAENLEVIIEFESGGADLGVQILGSGGQPIANGTATAANTKRAYVANLPVGVYYAQVTGPASGSVTTNNYDMTINVTGP